MNNKINEIADNIKIIARVTKNSTVESDYLLLATRATNCLKARSYLRELGRKV